MLPTTFLALTQQCAPAVAPATMAAVVRIESNFNPYAIGVVHGRLQRQPTNLNEAVLTARALQAAGWSFSVGLAQLNRANWSQLGLTLETVFDPCRNLAAGATILQGCFERASRARANAQDALLAGLSCYTSGNFSAGFRTGYVQRVVAQLARADPIVSPIDAHDQAISVIPVTPVTPGITATPESPYPDPSHHAAAGPSSQRLPNRPSDQPENVTQESAVVF